MEASTGDILFEKNARQRRAIASTTKLMTALVALQHSDLDDIFSATNYSAATIESQIGLRPGERMSVRDLLRAALLPSANDAAAALAVGTMGSTQAFVAEMNRRAAALGLKDTQYTTPIGLDDPRNYSSARDLAKLAIRLREYDFFRRTTDLPSATLRSGSRKRVVINRNTLVRKVAAVNGVKTGHTNRAGYVLVGSARRAGVTVVSVVLGEPSERARDADSLALLRYGLDAYEATTALPEGRIVGKIALRYRGDDAVNVVAGGHGAPRAAARHPPDRRDHRSAARGGRAAAARLAGRHGRRAGRRPGARACSRGHRPAGRRGRARDPPERPDLAIADDHRPRAAAGL